MINLKIGVENYKLVGFTKSYDLAFSNIDIFREIFDGKIVEKRRFFRPTLEALCKNSSGENVSVYPNFGISISCNKNHIAEICRGYIKIGDRIFKGKVFGDGKFTTYSRVYRDIDDEKVKICVWPRTIGCRACSMILYRNKKVCLSYEPKIFETGPLSFVSKTNICGEQLGEDFIVVFAMLFWLDAVKFDYDTEYSSLC